jgi:predicted porin
MKQKLMAAAIAGALAAPGLALAQATNVQIYGVMDLRIHTESYSGGGPGLNERKYGMHTGQPNRIGFRGTESLGGGLTAFFQVEQQVGGDARKTAALENGGNYLWGGRPTFLGLRGGWGEVSFGMQDSSYKDVGNVWNAVLTNNHTNIIMGHSSATGTAPNPNCITPGVSQATGALDATTATTPNGCGGDLPGNATSFNRTVSNSIKYMTPVIAGFRFSTLLEVPDYDEPGSVSNVGGIAAGASRWDPRTGSMALTWTGGPFSAGLAWERHQGYRASNTAATNRSAEDTGITLGGKWNFGVGQVGVGYEQLKYENSGTAAASNDFKIRNYVVNGQFRAAPNGVVSAAFSWTPGARNCGSGTPATGIVPNGGNVGCGSAGKARVLTVSYDHLLSKRTSLYATYGRIDNGSASNYYYFAGPLTNNTNGTTSGLARGQDATMLATGVKHSF